MDRAGQARVAAAFLSAALAIGCAHRQRGAEEEEQHNASEAAIQCARSTAQASGFTVRMRDPRNPWMLVAESTISSPPDRIVIRLIPGGAPEVPAIVTATAEGPRGTLAGVEAREAARSIEVKCGARG